MASRRIPATRTRPEGGTMRYFRWQRKYAPYIFISPFFILYAIFGLFPLLFSAYLSFQEWNPVQGLGAMEFVGLENYKFILEFSRFNDFWPTLYNTFWIGIVSGLAQHLVAIPLAFILILVLKRWRHGFTVAYFLPYVTSVVAIALVFSTMFGTQYGIINQLLVFLANAPLTSWLFGGLLESGALPINWLGLKENIKPAIAILVFWRYFGWNMVLYSAGLATIPTEYYEAAKVDGANLWQQFRHISLPLVRPVMFFAVSLSIIGGMQLFEEPFILVGPTGGVDNAGLTVAMYLYREGFDYNSMGTAAAVSWVLFGVIAILTIIQFLVSGRGGLETRE
jgi:multiple sugar transport system permease protein